MVTQNQYKQALSIATSKVAGLESEVTALKNAPPAPADLTGPATDLLTIANSIDPTVGTDPTLLPDVDPNVPAAPIASA